MLEVDTGVDHRHVGVHPKVIFAVDVDGTVTGREDPFDAGGRLLSGQRDLLVALDVGDLRIAGQGRRRCVGRRHREALHRVLVHEAHVATHRRSELGRSRRHVAHTGAEHDDEARRRRRSIGRTRQRRYGRTHQHRRCGQQSPHRRTPTCSNTGLASADHQRAPRQPSADSLPAPRHDAHGDGAMTGRPPCRCRCRDRRALRVTRLAAEPNRSAWPTKTPRRSSVRQIRHCTTNWFSRPGQRCAELERRGWA